MNIGQDDIKNIGCDGLYRRYCLFVLFTSFEVRCPGEPE